MVDQKLKDLRGAGRRNFLKFATTAGAVLALDRAKVLDVIADTAGVAMADNGTCNLTNRSVHLVGGNGGFAWFTQLFPQIDQATSTDPAVAFYAQGKAIKATDTDKPLYYSPDTPWTDLDKGKRISRRCSWRARTRRIPRRRTPGGMTVERGSEHDGGHSRVDSARDAFAPSGHRRQPRRIRNRAPARPASRPSPTPTRMVQLFNSAASRALLSQPQDAALLRGLLQGVPRPEPRRRSPRRGPSRSTPARSPRASSGRTSPRSSRLPRPTTSPATASTPAAPSPS